MSVVWLQVLWGGLDLSDDYLGTTMPPPYSMTSRPEYRNQSVTVEEIAWLLKKADNIMGKLSNKEFASWFS